MGLQDPSGICPMYTIQWSLTCCSGEQICCCDPDALWVVRALVGLVVGRGVSRAARAIHVHEVWLQNQVLWVEAVGAPFHCEHLTHLTIGHGELAALQTVAAAGQHSSSSSSNSSK